jgi:hypothetical protein
MRGKQMHGWLHLDAASIDSERELAKWINRAVAHNKGNQKTAGSSAAAARNTRRRSPDA